LNVAEGHGQNHVSSILSSSESETAPGAVLQAVAPVYL
jgi:hypothetical protein